MEQKKQDKLIEIIGACLIIAYVCLMLYMAATGHNI